MSVDGFVSTGLNDEQHWVTWAWDEFVYMCSDYLILLIQSL